MFSDPLSSLDYFVLFCIVCKIIYGIIFIPHVLVKNRKAINKLINEKPDRKLSLREQQILYQIYGKKFPIGPVFNIEGDSFRLISPPNANFCEYLIGPYRVWGAHLTPFLQDCGNVQAEIYVYRKKSYLLSANDNNIINYFSAQWEARFAPNGFANALNIEIVGRRPTTAEERQQLKLPSIRPLRFFRTLGLILFTLYSAFILSATFDTTPYFSNFLGAVSLASLPMVYRYYAKCPFNRPFDKSVVLAKGTVVGCEGRKVWFTGSEEQIPEDPGRCFIVPIDRDTTLLEPGQSVQFGFVPSRVVTQLLHFEPREEDYHPCIVCIDNVFNAGEQFCQSPFVAWHYPYIAILLGANPLLASIPVLINKDRAADYLSHWPFYLHLSLGFFWLILGGSVFLYRYAIYRRHKNRLF